MELTLREHDLDLVDLDQHLTGYRQFIGCWVRRSAGLTFLVDPGPTATAGHLVEALGGLGVDRVDYVLLTHIHLDHGGGTADVLEAFPEAKYFCLETGVKHMQAPGRLWEGSLATIGEIAETYKEPRPVPEGRLVTAEELAARGIRVIPTPGHASHHVSFLHAQTLFAGEAIATRIPLEGGDDYLRPATPPRFLLDVFLESLERLATLDPEPQLTAFAHWGLGEGCAAWCRLAREQLLLWIAEVERLSRDGVGDLDAIFTRLRAVDPSLAHWDALSADIQEREHYYAKNSLRGMLRYLDERQGRA